MTKPLDLRAVEARLESQRMAVTAYAAAVKQRGLTLHEQNALDAATEYDEDVTALLAHCRALRAALQEDQEALMNLRTWNSSMHGAAPLAPAGRALERAAAVLAGVKDE